jgi:exodeoxyribonuclease V alpha subunit
MLQRNLVYTGVTRGKRLVVLVGQRKALAIAVKGARTRRRWSKLREWLIGNDRLSTAVLMHQIDGSVGSSPEID